MQPTTPSPIPSAHSASSVATYMHRSLLQAFLNPDFPELAQIAEDLRLTVTKIADWAAAPSTAEHLEKLATVFELRGRVLLAQALPSAIEALRQLAAKITPDDPEATTAERSRYRETSRRAATQLIQTFLTMQANAAETAEAAEAAQHAATQGQPAENSIEVEPDAGRESRGTLPASTSVTPAAALAQAAGSPASLIAAQLKLPEADQLLASIDELKDADPTFLSAILPTQPDQSAESS